MPRCPLVARVFVPKTVTQVYFSWRIAGFHKGVTKNSIGEKYVYPDNKGKIIACKSVN
jgi:hypothetical protein